MTSNEVVQAIVTLVVGVTGGGAVVALLNRRKTSAEARSIAVTGELAIVDRAMSFNRDLLARVEKLEAELSAVKAAAEQREAELESRIAALEEDNRGLRERCRKLEEENGKLKGKS